MLGVNCAFVGDHIPCAVRALAGLAHHAMGFNRCTAHTRGFCIGMRGARGVKVAVKRVIKPTDDPVDVCNRRDLFDLFWADNLGIEAHKSVLGALRQQHIKPVLVVGKRDTANMVQTAGHAGDFLQLFVEPDGIALEGGHIGVAV